MDSTQSSLFPSRLTGAGLHLLRYGLAAILLFFGALKWTTAESESLRPWISHSPFLAWMYGMTSVQGASIVIGVIELAIAGALLLRQWFPWICAAGSAVAIGMFFITLSFLFTTPNMDPASQGFLMKDIFGLGIAVWSTGEAWAAARSREVRQ